MAPNKPQIRISKWDEYQHYPPGSRQMIWAKLYSKRLSDYDLMNLSASARELSTCLICIAIETDNCIPNDSLWLLKRAHMTPLQIRKGIADLLAIGFVEPILRKRRASTAIAPRYPLTETETEEEEEIPTAVVEGANGEPVDLKVVHKNGFHAERLIEAIGSDADDRTAGQVRSFIGRLPDAVFERIREQLVEGLAGHRGKYAHAELKREVAARSAA